MTDDDPKDPAQDPAKRPASDREGAGAGTVFCRRTGQPTPVDEHVQCPYCHGELDDVKAGDHSEFCNFDPEKDPIHFGFPPDSDRHLHG